jgi:ABC-type dipeptide/oligopeptide/nickel transport systems, permease components
MNKKDILNDENIATPTVETVVDLEVANPVNETVDLGTLETADVLQNNPILEDEGYAFASVDDIIPEEHVFDEEDSVSEEPVSEAISKTETDPEVIADTAVTHETVEKSVATPEIIADAAPATEEAAQSTASTELVVHESLADSVRIMSPGKLVMKRFFRSRLSIVGLVMIVFLFAFSFIGPLFSPWGEVQKTGDFKWTRSTIPHQITVTEINDAGESVKVTYEYYEVSDPYQVFSKTPPSKAHVLGTDQYGYDVLTRLMYGGRVSLLLSFIVIFAELFLGTVIGAVSGYFGKWVDQIIMRIVDIFNCLPGLPIMLLAASLLDSWSVPSNMRIYALMGILTIFGWSGIARLVRGQILMLREQEFMIAAEATGISVRRKIFKHLIPNVMPQLIVQATLGLGGIILYEATLSWLGLGVPFPYAAWGSMIGATSGAGGRDILQNYPNLWIPAGVLIVIAVLGFNFIGDGLRDAFDPKAKR